MLTKEIYVVSGTDGVIYATDIQDTFRVSGTAVLGANWAVVYTGTPVRTEIRKIRYEAKGITLGAFGITFLGHSMPAEYVAKDLDITAQWNGTSWEVNMVPDFDEDSIINGGTKIIAATITGDRCVNKTIDTGQIADGAIEALQLNTNAVTTIKVLDQNITLPKIAAQADNTVLVNVSGGVDSPTALAAAVSRFLGRLAAGALKFCTVAEMQTELAIRTTALASANLWVGNGGGTAAAVAPSGDLTMDNTGLFTIANSVIEPDNLGQKVVSSRTTGVVAVKIIEGAVLKALLDATLNDLCAFATGDTVLRVLSTVQTPHGAPMTFDIGVDAVIRTAGADANGLVEVANGGAAGKYDSDNATYSGALLDFGQFTADAAGNLTITSTVDASAGAFVGCITIYYLPT